MGKAFCGGFRGPNSLERLEDDELPFLSHKVIFAIRLSPVARNADSSTSILTAHLTCY